MIRMIAVMVGVLLLGGGVSLAGDYKLYLKSAEIKDKKANGDDWDAFGGKPDPFVEVQILGNQKTVLDSAKSLTAKNTLKPSWDESVITVNVGDEILIKIWDEDLQFNDLIGEYRFTVTKDMVGANEQSTSFDQVTTLKFSVKPR